MEDAKLTGDPNIEIENIEYDSRMLRKNSLFIAVNGYKRDGYDFVKQAKENGAVAVMGERKECPDIENHVTVVNVRKAMADVAAKFYGFPGLKIKACGVTGTNGKTTTCYLMKNILETRNKITGLVTSQIYDTGREVFDAERTTPEALDLQRLLFLMRKNFCVNAVIEVSSHALVLHRVDNIDFRVAVYTNLTRDHLDFHRTMDEYFKAKALLAKRLKGELSYLVINLDVPEFQSLLQELDASYMTYSLSDNQADVYCQNYEIKPEGTTFDLMTPMGKRTISIKLAGRFNLINAVAAAAGGLACGADLDSVVVGLEKAQAVSGRFNYLNVGQPFAVYVDYAHTPDAIARLCRSAREIAQGRLLLLFGCGGDRDKGKRPLMGQVATTQADYVVVTSDNPRAEDPLAIIEDIKPGLVGNNYEIYPDRKEAIDKIMKKAQADDVVLLAGKGAENYQEVKGVKHPFSDEEEALKVLAAMGYTVKKVDEEI
ncbi:MAG: UDP-N-acetylmuramoyl-L-alanyl-D-glutamate--2,6-diaminopimelate ligase [FCB group bacterium]|nr:UDP-N-acetylmuramoyl-L-alanyl-D-glutamate--2,6-diaminopimelate ligase [FCB group bacterium]